MAKNTAFWQNHGIWRKSRFPGFPCFRDYLLSLVITSEASVSQISPWFSVTGTFIRSILTDRPKLFISFLTQSHQVFLITFVRFPQFPLTHNAWLSQHCLCVQCVQTALIYSFNHQAGSSPSYPQALIFSVWSHTPELVHSWALFRWCTHCYFSV